MAKRINQLTQTTTIADADLIAIDSSDASGQTRSISTKNLKANLLSQNSLNITASTKFSTISFDHIQYIDSGAYTKPYIATANCIVFWHIEWDCNGNDGLTMQIIDGSKNVKAEIPIMRDFEGNDSAWMNKNGSIALGPGIGIRFKGANAFNTNSGNQLTYVVATN